MMQSNVADTSKTEYHKQRTNIRVLMQREDMIYSEQKVALHLYCIRQEPLRLTVKFLCKQDQACTHACTST
jgi:hypothetical protein